MSGPSKMIIITSNEDIIQQLQLNQNSDVKIIDLDKQKSNNNVEFVIQFSANNSNGDQISKRSLDSSDKQQTQPAKTPRKSSELVCVICGARAIGFNYDVLSCGSCKAFFRRNAFQDLNHVRCLNGDGSCSVQYDVRRKCQRCRLQRCFAMGMRKDFIVTDEEKQRRKQRLEENRNETSKRSSISESTISSNGSSVPQSIVLTSNASSVSQSIVPTSNEMEQLLMDIESLNEDLLSDENYHLIQSETLSEEDWSIIQHVQTSFLNTFQLQSSSCISSLDLSDRLSALISWSEFLSNAALCLINYFRQITEFENLTNDDRFILVKYNLFVIFPICKCLYYKETNDFCSDDSSEEAEKHRRFSLLCGVPTSMQNTFIDLVISFVQLTKQDPTILSLLLTILIFSPCLSMIENEPPLNNPLAVHEAQSHYVKLLWNYLVNEWGEDQAEKYFIQLMAIILKLQTGTKTFRDVFRHQYESIDDIDKIAPLMQSVLHIS